MTAPFITHRSSCPTKLKFNFFKFVDLNFFPELYVLGCIKLSAEVTRTATTCEAFFT